MFGLFVKKTVKKLMLKKYHQMTIKETLNALKNIGKSCSPRESRRRIKEYIPSFYRNLRSFTQRS